MIPPHRHNVEMYRKVLSQYEVWVTELTGEKNALLSCLQNVASSLQTLARKHARVR